MRRTRMSFFYLMSYLALGGIALVVAPEQGVRLLGSNGTYPPAMLRFLGGFMIALAIVIIQIVRHRIEVLYPTTLMVRTVLLATVVWLFLDTRDPLFLTLTGIIALGMILTSLALITDRTAGAARGTAAQAR
jgi:uncharacterized protein YjeT (DUF2065 family)